MERSSWTPGVGLAAIATDILVVDDTPANLLAFEVALGDLATRVVRANSGAEALRLLLDHDFALVILDVQMPGMNGFDTARLIRERRRSRHTPIIFVTAHQREDEDVREAYALGAVDFLLQAVRAGGAAGEGRRVRDPAAAHRRGRAAGRAAARARAARAQARARRGARALGAGLAAQADGRVGRSRPAPRTSSWPCSRTSCATRSRRSSPASS